MQICESFGAELFREAVLFLLDNFYTAISDLDRNKRMQDVDIVYHHACLSYTQKYQQAMSVKQNRPIRINEK